MSAPAAETCECGVVSRGLVDGRCASCRERDARGTLLVELRCRCGKTVNLPGLFHLTKMGTLRAQGSAEGWYVDGGRTCCPDHHPDPLPSPQMETWREYDRRGVEEDQEHEARQRKEERVRV
jgi:hypothetical protein